MLNAITSFDLSLLYAIRHACQSAFCDAVMPVISQLTDAGLIWIALAAILLCFRKTRKIGLSIGIALALGLALGNGVIKLLVNRVRPYDLPDMEAIRASLLIPPLTDPSFPSGHTLACFEAATALICYHRPSGIAAFVLAFLTGFSRLYLFVHYPTDVLGGAFLGVLIGLLGCRIVEAVYRKWGHTKLLVSDKENL